MCTMCSPVWQFFVEFILFFSVFYILVPPMIWVQNQLVGAYEGQRITLECQSEAYPKSINYWTREKGEIVPQSMLKFKLSSI